MTIYSFFFCDSYLLVLFRDFAPLSLCLESFITPTSNLIILLLIHYERPGMVENHDLPLNCDFIFICNLEKLNLINYHSKSDNSTPAYSFVSLVLYLEIHHFFHRSCLNFMVDSSLECLVMFLILTIFHFN